jgi:phytoene dehydrogenase-like protein
MGETVDAVVVGAGPNGLTAANVLAAEGWSVVVLEAQATPGGAVRTEELTEPGFHHDVFSSFYPLAAASPPLVDLHLEDHGLRWRRSEAVVAHVFDDARAALLFADPERTAASVGAFAAADADAWRRWSAWWERVGPSLTAALMRPFPPVRPAARLARALGSPAEALRFGRLGVLPLRRHVEEEFAGEGAALLLAGNALHADFAPESPGSTIYAWTLAGLGQQVGFPVPEGGARGLVDALVARLRAHGGEVRCGEPVVAIERDRTVRTAGGSALRARHAVVATTDAPALYERLLPADALSPRARDDLRRFAWDPSTIKVDWALDGPIPWGAPDAARAATVHLADDLDHLTRWASDLQRGAIPDRPFVVAGQYARTDPTRMPPGREILYAYTHLPQGAWEPGVEEDLADRVEAEVERRAPGFRRLIRARHVLSPAAMEARDANLVGGALNGGTAQLHQQLVFRPIPGDARPGTPVDGVYLGSASAHPGGGVHGAAGANAARAAMARARRRGRLRRA